jgi:chromosomal replication initiator protein
VGSGTTTIEARSAQQNTKPRGFTAVDVDEILGKLERELGEVQFQRYFNGQTRLALSDTGLDVIVASGFQAQMLDRRFGEQLRRIASIDAPQEAGLEVRFQVDRAAFEHAASAGVARPAAPAAPQRQAPAPPRPSPTPGRLTFSTFIVGKSNRLAHSAAVRLAEEEHAPPVLFVHGSCGLGKTHLLHALAARFQEQRPGAVVRYTTAEAFTNEFITALRQKKVDAFRRLYRKVDLLCLDDAHFLSSKEATQTELLHTFDAIGMEGARIAMASDEHPRDTAKLSDKLASRFLAGVVVRIESPDPELRGQLVRRLALARGLALDDLAIELLCDRSSRSVGSLGGFGGSVRELEGLMTQIDAVHRLMPEPGGSGRIGVGLLRKALGLGAPGDGPAPAMRPRRPIPAAHVLAEVCRSLNVDITEFIGKGRHQRVVLARSLVAFLCRRLTTLSFPEIARAMGRGNHSTVITAHKRIEDELATSRDRVLRAEVAPGHAGCTLGELVDELSRQIVASGARA